jgi:AraC-like DNA-binding protein
VADLARFELLLRGMGVGLALALAAGMLQRRPRTFGAGASAALSLGIGAYLVCSGGARCSASPWLFPLLLMAVANPFLFWWAARAVFDDGFKPRPRQFAILAALEALVLATAYAPLPGLVSEFSLASHAVGLGLVAHALYVVLVGWRDDLVENRRQLRGAYLFVVGGYVLIVLAAEVWLHGQPPPPALSMLNAAGITAVLFLSCCWFLSADPLRSELFWPAASAATEPGAPRSGVGDERDTRAVARIHELFGAERIYRDAELSVESLARKVGVAEHRLRAIVNRGLGQRNFAAFVNGYRLSEAQRRLEDPAEVRVPVLTIALEAGFGSIGPFNRAFKQKTGLTPTEYRSRAAAR